MRERGGERKEIFFFFLLEGRKEIWAMDLDWLETCRKGDRG